MPDFKDDQATQINPAAGEGAADPGEKIIREAIEEGTAQVKKALASLGDDPTDEELTGTITPEQAQELAYAGARAALAASNNSIETVMRLTESVSKVIKQATQFYASVSPVAVAAIETMQKAAAVALGMAEKWQARQDEFYNSGKWDQLQKEFPEVTNDTATPILFVGLMDAVLYQADAIKRKMQEYEADTGTHIDFNDLVEIETGGPQGTLLEAFLDEIYEEEGQEPASAGLPIPEKAKAPEIQQVPSLGVPKYFTLETSLLASAIMNMDGRGEVINAGGLEIPVLNIGKSDEITIFADLKNDMELPGVKPGQVFPKYKREYYGGVYGAANTLYWDRIRAGVLPIVTPEIIYRTMTHKTDAEYISPRQAEAARECFEYWRRTDSFVDATDELKERQKKRPGGPPIEEFKHGGAMIAADPIRVKAGGVIKEGYLLLRPPLLSLYSETVNNQRITVKGIALDIKEVNSAGEVTTVSIPATDNRIAVIFYMLRRVAVMREDEANAREKFRKYKNGCRKRREEPTKELKDFRNVNRTISVNTVFKAAEIPKKSQYNTRKDILNILKYWRAMDYTGEKGFIKDFKTRKKGKTIDAVIIEVW